MKIEVPVNSTYHEVNNERAREWEKQQSDKYKEYRNKWTVNPKNFIVDDAPLHLDIEPTNACNLKCPMCPRTVLLNDENKNSDFHIGSMDMNTFKKIIDEAVDIGVYSVKLNWLGEPLVHSNIVDMVAYAKGKGIIDVMFNTNAVLLTEDISRRLIEAGLDKIFFSFDSPLKEKYEQIRIGANFEDTLNNIIRFTKIRTEMGKAHPLTRVSMVLMENNKEEYDKYVEIFRNIVDIVAYVEYREPVGNETNETKLYEQGFACSQLWQRMFIAWDGEVIPCCVDSQRELVMGNIHKDTIKDIWNNEVYSNIRKLHKDGMLYELDLCRKCALPMKSQDGTI
ncbi:radical SAM/SPASM domain-containing protein [Desulfosporosinus metallidurans]|uniref:Radical SAM domain protein n=1 Tax=Desulfosporosinus metallidurans TaxID=1888891 RepID=A0A1Q8R1R7_9FIRM|nr:radical SAM protein [Desulfosporosinus metallidurans]OLN33524.1 Radical SAM domain protein [Desulfosporosinus metallidurans]